MKHLDFFDELVQMYKRARIITLRESSPNVKRCTKKVVSGEAEDLFGIYAYELINDTDSSKILICPTIRIANKSRIPDIVICKGYEIMEMWDLKMDMGWNRGALPDLLKDHDDMVNSILTLKSGVKMQDHVYSVSQKLKYNILVVSTANGGNPAFEKAILLKLKHANIFRIFDEKYHPNSNCLPPEDVRQSADKNMDIIDSTITSLYY